MSDPARHDAVMRVSVLNNVLQVAGRPVSAVAEQVGRTPFYAYDSAHIQQRVAAVRAALPDGVHVHYAIKANPMPAVLDHLAPRVDGFDVASCSELERALATTMSASRISVAGPGKSEALLRHAVQAGVVINVESALELERLAGIGAELGMHPKVAVRINPDFELKASGMKMGGGPKPFGIDAECVPEVLNRMRALPVAFCGFHLFAGSQSLDAAAIIEAQRSALDLIRHLSVHAPGPIRLLNLGGGFGIPYFPGEKALDLTAVGRGMASLMESARRDFPEAEIVLELGRYLVGEAGMYVCRVVDRKVSRGQLFLVTDGGMHQHLAASGNLGQVLRKNFPVLVGSRVHAGEGETAIASVVGPLCTPLDVLADKMPLGHAQVGDLIVVLQSGAYGLTASPTGFLGHPPAVEILL